MYGNFKEKRASLKKLESAADSRFKSLPKKTTSKHQRASFKARDAAAANSKVASNDFKARPMPKAQLSMTPAAMKARRIVEEKDRQSFRERVESFYLSKPELEKKWEKARDVLLVKYSSGTKWKSFESKLIEKYGEEFLNFKSSFVKVEKEDDGRVACGCCGRRFALNRVFEHERVCGGSKRQKQFQEEKSEEQVEEENEQEYERAALELEEKMSQMTEIEAMEYQLNQMRRLQALKNGQ